MDNWKEKIIEIFKECRTNHNRYYLSFGEKFFGSCGDINFFVWRDIVSPKLEASNYNDFTTNYKKYYSRTKYVIDKLLKEDLIEISENKTKKNSNIYKLKKKVFKLNIKFINNESTNNN